MRKGFTLIELIVVIAIIAVLAAVVAPNAFKAIEKGKRSAGIADFKTIKTASMAYYADTGIWPVDNDVFTADDATTPITGWDGPYIEKWPPKTPWGGDYLFEEVAPADWDGASDDVYVLTFTGTNPPAQTIVAIDVAIDGEDDPDDGDVQVSDAGQLQMLIAAP